MSRPRIIADGRYEIFEQLGAGGFKSVWRAKDALLRRDVALAVLRDDQGVLRKSFWREATALSALVTELPPEAAPFSARVVALTDFGELDDEPPFRGPFLVTHLVEGVTLKEALRAAPFPWPRAVKITIGILEALEVSHTPTSRRVSIVHRDIKPSNIMLSAGDAVTVLDFGVAKLVEATRSEQSQVVGTLRYMAPEQLEPGSEIGPRADLFSVGVVLHELVTGQTPWDRDSLASAAKFYASVHLGEVPALDALAKVELPPDLARIIQRALNIVPSGRPDSARQMRGALEALFEGDRLDLEFEPSPRAPSLPTALLEAPEPPAALDLELADDSYMQGLDLTLPSPARRSSATPLPEAGLDGDEPRLELDRSPRAPAPPHAEPPRVAPVPDRRRFAFAPWLVLLAALGVGGVYVGHPWGIEPAPAQAAASAPPHAIITPAAPAPRPTAPAPRPTAPAPRSTAPAPNPTAQVRLPSTSPRSAAYELSPTHAQSQTIDRCIRRHRAELADRPSHFEVELFMQSHGRPTDVKVVDGAWWGTSLAQCVEAAVVDWSLPGFVGAGRQARFEVRWRRRSQPAR